MNDADDFVRRTRRPRPSGRGDGPVFAASSARDEEPTVLFTPTPFEPSDPSKLRAAGSSMAATMRASTSRPPSSRVTLARQRSS